MRKQIITSVALMSFTGCIALTGCGPTRARTSTYTAADMDIAVVEIRDKLASSPFMSTRSSDSPSLVFQPNRMENLSNERISRVDQWAVVSRVLLDPSMLEMLGSKNITVTLPPVGERITNSYLSAGTDADSGANLTFAPQSNLLPTHMVDARFSSITRASSEDEDGGLADVRKDLFLMDFTIFMVRTREIVWAGSVEFARVAEGLLAN